MRFRNNKDTYIWSICIGATTGLLFLACFFAMFGNPIFIGNSIFDRVNDLVDFVSLPVFYLLGNKLSSASIILGIPLFIIYWMILGMCIAYGIVWLYFFILRKFKMVETSGN